MVHKPLMDIKDIASNESPVTSEPTKAQTFNHHVVETLKMVRPTNNAVQDVLVEIQHDGTCQLYPLESEIVADTLIDLFDAYEGNAKGTSLSNAKLQDTLTFMRAKSRTLASKRPVYKRTAYIPEEDSIYFDLSNANGEVVKIDASGWNVLKPAHPMFVRYSFQTAAPTPQISDYDLKNLQSVLPNGFDDKGTKLFIGTLIAMILPTNFKSSPAYPVILVRGEPGSGKTTLTKNIKSLIDPEIEPLSNVPSSSDDLYIVSQYSQVLAFDNIDGMKGDASDDICRITCGGSYKKRKLYSNGTLVSHYAHSPVILNGIGDLVFKQDIIDRSVSFPLKAMESHNDQSESQFQAQAPHLMGYLFGLISRSLQKFAQTVTPQGSRLATVNRFISAAEPFGTEEPFSLLLKQNQEEALASSLEGNLVTQAIIDFMANKQVWEGTHQELLIELCSMTDDKLLKSDEWPKTPNKLKSFFAFKLKALSNLGIDYKPLKRTGSSRPIRLAVNSKYKPPITSPKSGVIGASPADLDLKDVIL